MSSIDAAIVAALKADAGVSALVGARVFTWGGQQDAAFPYLTVQDISWQGATHMNGPSNLDWPRFQFDAWSPVALVAVNVREAIRTAFEAQTLTAAGRTFTATLQDQRGPTPDETTRNFSASLDFYIWHNR